MTPGPTLVASVGGGVGNARNDALQWNIKSDMAGKIPVEIRYFTSGITWKADYVGIANQDETKLRLTGYVRVFNNSGELYDNAQTRLVVGTINLVEKIADLATRPSPGPPPAPAEPQSSLRAKGEAIMDLAEKYDADERHGRLDNDLIDYDETFVYDEEIVSGKPVVAKTEIERKFDADVFLWGSEGKPDGWEGDEPRAYVDMHEIGGRVERVDQNHVKYFLNLNPGEKRFVRYSVTYKRRKVGPELNAEKKREPL